MNNNFFALLRYLLDLGMDTHLFLFSNEATHFLPESDSFDFIRYAQYIHTLPFSNSYRDVYTVDSKIISDIFCDYEILIGCGLSPAFLVKAKRNLDIFVPYGSDFYAEPFLSAKLFEANSILKRILFFIYFIVYAYTSHLQKKGIQNSSYIFNLGILTKLHNSVANKLDVHCFPISVPMVYIENNEYVPKEIEPVIDRIKYSDLVIVNQSRQYWKTIYEKDSASVLKGNDILIRGFALFIKRTILKSPCLILFEYGPDVQHSKDLVSELQIQPYVLWLPLMSRKFILKILQFADIGADQFISPYFGGTGNEHLAAGIPFFSKMISNEEYRELTGYDLPPGVISASTPEEICKYLLKYESDREFFKHLGFENKKWFDEYAGAGLARKYKTIIEDIYRNKMAHG